MAREHRTPEMIDAMAKNLADGAASLTSIAALMRTSKMPSALIHGATAESLYIPAVLDWIEKTTADIKVQLRAHAAGKPSEVERRKKYSDNQKLAAAKKAPKKKTA